MTKNHGRPLNPTMPPAPNKKYKVIMADPPWATYGEALKHYPNMAMKDLVQIPVKEWAEDDSMLMVWALNWRMEWALELINAWGFTYKTVGLVWVKTNSAGDRVLSGRGFYVRQSVELCLLATRGSPIKTEKPGALKATTEQVIIAAPRSRHSEKPDDAYTAVEGIIPDATRLEMFSRRQRLGWDPWGNEV